MDKKIDKTRLQALIKKETLQIVRDPAAIIIAFILPVVLLYLFANAISLDIKNIPLGVVKQADSVEANQLYSDFKANRYFKIIGSPDTCFAKKMLIDEKIDGYIVIPADLKTRLINREYNNLVQVITDGAQPNSAKFVENYTKGVINNWLGSLNITKAQIKIENRLWYNPEMQSKKYLVPGAIGIIMTMIGTLLTALVIAREWERGTMEALFATPTTIYEILLGKLIPYFALAMLATLLSALLATLAFNVPFRGSWLALFCLSATFMLPALAQGLLISTLAKNQFIASMAALLSAFLPAFLLSGFLFEIDSMPVAIQLLTDLLAVKYFISSIETVFLTGDVWSLFLPNMLAMFAIGGILLGIALKNTHKSLDKISFKKGCN